MWSQRAAHTARWGASLWLQLETAAAHVASYAGDTTVSPLDEPTLN